MGNFFTDTLGKIAGNVTQSVASALIVTAITTYLIVSPGKKEEAKDGAGKDSAKSSATVTPLEQSGAAGEVNQTVQPPGESGVLGKADAGKNMNAGGGTVPVSLPAAEKTVPTARMQPPVNESATKAYKELSPDTPAEQKLERTITEGRAKGDSLASARSQNDKAKEIKQEEKKQTKDVKKRADEVFDELDQEVQK